MKVLYILILFAFPKALSQNWINAEPYKVIYNEFDINNKIYDSKTIRPTIIDNNSLSIGFSSEYYINNNISNQENMGIKYFGKGTGRYFSYLFALNNDYFFLERGAIRPLF